MLNRKITQSELSKATGITQSSISYWMRRKYLPKQDKVDIIARALDVTLPTSWDGTAQTMST